MSRLATTVALLFAATALGCEAPRETSSHRDVPPQPPLLQDGSARTHQPTGTSDEAAPMTGVLVPENEITLTASGFGRLERLDVQLGDHVDEGDVVAQLDVRGDRSDLAAATASWKASAAELERLELELERAKQTRTDVEQLEDFVSKAEIREQRFAEKLAAARRRSAGASLREQRSRMTEVQTRISEAELRAPFSGEVSQRFVDPGATLSAGEAVVELISDQRRVRFAVPEARGHALHEGATVEIRFGDDTTTFSGTVVTIAPEIEAGTRIILAEASLDPTDERLARLRVGAVAQVRFRE